MLSLAEKTAAAEAKAREQVKLQDSKASKANSAQPQEVDASKTKAPQTILRTWEVPGGKTKDQRLGDLYDAYSRDLISPSEYHRARAKIIGEP